MKSINDIIDAVHLSPGSRNPLIIRIKEKYKKEIIMKKYGNSKIKCILISDEDFKIIVKLEKIRKLYGDNYKFNNFAKKEKSQIQINREKGLYTRLTP